MCKLWTLFLRSYTHTPLFIKKWATYICLADSPKKQKLQPQAPEGQHKIQHLGMNFPEQSWYCQPHQSLEWSWCLELHLSHSVVWFHFCPTRLKHHNPEITSQTNKFEFYMYKLLLQVLRKFSTIDNMVFTLTKQSWKWRRIRLAPILESDCKACWTALRTMLVTFGQVVE